MSFRWLDHWIVWVFISMHFWTVRNMFRDLFAWSCLDISVSSTIVQCGALLKCIVCFFFFCTNAPAATLIPLNVIYTSNHSIDVIVYTLCILLFLCNTWVLQLSNAHIGTLLIFGCFLKVGQWTGKRQTHVMFSCLRPSAGLKRHALTCAFFLLFITFSFWS